MRVLVAGDNPASAFQLRAILAFAGHDTCVCRTGSDAVVALRNLALDIAVIDFGMTTNGTSLTSLDFALVARASSPENVLIGVVLRDDDMPLEPKDLCQHGIDFIIQKPYRVDAVQEAITAAMGCSGKALSFGPRQERPQR